MMPVSVLPMSDPQLRIVSDMVQDLADPQFQLECQLLKSSLDQFRAERGFGRGIAAPQIGIAKRFIALNLGQGTFAMINPEITWKSESTFTMWDDCMCFPDLLVKVLRHNSISVRFIDENGTIQMWSELERSSSELLQHEIDHLNGVLATDLAMDEGSAIQRTQFEADFDKYAALVDYVITPTV